MISINQVVLTGRLTDAPEMRYTKEGMAIAMFSVATNMPGGIDKDTGKRKQDAHYFRVSSYKKTAEAVGQYLKKGSPVVVLGKLRQIRWTTESGEKRYRIEVMASSVQFLPDARDFYPKTVDDDKKTHGTDYSDPVDTTPEEPEPTPGGVSDDDIPF